MKKRNIALICSALMFTILLSGCGETSETIHSEKVQTAVGSYSIFRTKYAQEYLNFLENFDETKFEIVDISTSMQVAVDGSDEFYIVTYKTISQ